MVPEHEEQLLLPRPVQEVQGGSFSRWLLALALSLHKSQWKAG